jgi:PA14 domain
LGASQHPLAEILKAYYPKGVYHEVKHKITGDLLYWSYLVDPQDIAAGAHQRGGLKAQYFQDTPTDPRKAEAGPHWVSALRRKVQVDPFLLFDWPVSPVPGWFSAEWTGSLRISQAGRYTFWVNSNSYGLLEIDGRKIIEQTFLPAEREAKEGSVVLQPGRHSIRVRYFEARNYSRMELWWQKPGGQKEVVPSQVLLSE